MLSYARGIFLVIASNENESREIGDESRCGIPMAELTGQRRDPRLEPIPFIISGGNSDPYQKRSMLLLC
jgi:hypothetical protein